MAEFKAITTQDELDAVIGDRLQRERNTIAKQYEGWLSPEAVSQKFEGFLSPEQVAEKYDGYLSPEQVAEKDAQIKRYETASVKTRIAYETGIPYELVDRLSGEDETAIRADAEKLANFLAKPTTADPLGSTETATVNGNDSSYKALAAALTKGE